MAKTIISFNGSQLRGEYFYKHEVSNLPQSMLEVKGVVPGGYLFKRRTDTGEDGGVYAERFSANTKFGDSFQVFQPHLLGIAFQREGWMYLTKSGDHLGSSDRPRHELTGRKLLSKENAELIEIQWHEVVTIPKIPTYRGKNRYTCVLDPGKGYEPVYYEVTRDYSSGAIEFKRIMRLEPRQFGEHWFTSATELTETDDTNTVTYHETIKVLSAQFGIAPPANTFHPTTFGLPIGISVSDADNPTRRLLFDGKDIRERKVSEQPTAAESPPSSVAEPAEPLDGQTDSTLLALSIVLAIGATLSILWLWRRRSRKPNS